MTTQISKVNIPPGGDPRILETIEFMNAEFNRYIEATDGRDIPWWYNERAVLGFYAAGLARQKDTIVLQEFACSKGKAAKKEKSHGRADLLFRYKDHNYMVEAKLCFSPIDTKGDEKDAERWADEALEQAHSYDEDDFPLKPDFILSLCFEVIYCHENKKEKMQESLEGWRDTKWAKSDSFYYALIEIDQNNEAVKKEKIKYNWPDQSEPTDYYPALAVYGKIRKT